MSWLFSQALVEAFSGAGSSDGEPSAPLSVMPTPHKFWRNDKTMEPSKLSQFGLTCAVLTEDRGAELLMSFLEASRARTSARPARAQGSKVNAPASGLNLLGSLARWDPASSSWKTPQCSLVEGLDEFSETWPRWGSMRNGASWARMMPALPTSESGSGFWPTPCASEVGPRLETLQAKDGTEPKLGARVYRQTPKGLVNQTRTLGLMVRVVQTWPTPQAHDCHPGNPARVGRFGTKHGGRNLNDEVAMWPTPTAMKDTGGAALCKWGGAGARAKLKTMVTPEELNGSLNPQWVAWLMGWPTEWTSLKPLGTDKFQAWLHWHSQPSTAA